MASVPVEVQGRSVLTMTETPEERRARIQAAVRRDPRRMTLQLARDLGEPEAEVVRALPDGRSVELDLGRWEEMIRSFEALGQVHVIVSNGAATLEAVGRFGGFSTSGEFFNVQTKSIDMHVRYRELGAAFAVEKPSHLESAGGQSEKADSGPLAGRRTTVSVQFFDRAGNSAFKVFLNFGGTVSPERAAQFEELRERFGKT
jgi:putative hemin transport protein